mgnify:CR=1 FL=1
MGYTAFLLMVINILSKILGFFREILLSYFYGTGEIATAFQISFLVPYTILGFVMSGLSTNFIPTYTSLENKKGRNLKISDKVFWFSSASKFIAIKTGEKNARFLSKTLIPITNNNKLKGLICMLFVILFQRPIEKKTIKYGMKVKESVFINKKREQKRLIKKNSKNRSI